MKAPAEIEIPQKRGEALIQSLNWRYATKKFDPERGIKTEDMDTLMEALRLSASSMGLQPYRFLRIRDAALRKELRAASMDQAQITDAAEMIVFAAKRKYTETDISDFLQESQEQRGYSDEDVEKRRKSIRKHVNSFDENEFLNWTSRQLYIAVGQLLCSAASLGIDACPMEGFKAKEYARILSLDSKGLQAFAVVTLGYRLPEDALAKQAKIRLPQSKLFIEY